MNYQLFRRPEESNKVYLQVMGPNSSPQYSVSPEILSQMGLSGEKIDTRYNDPLYYYSGDLTSSRQLTNLYRGYGVAGVNNPEFKSNMMAETPSWMTKYFDNPVDFDTSVSSQFNLPPVPEDTPYMKAFKAGKKQGLTPEQISQQWVSSPESLNAQLEQARILLQNMSKDISSFGGSSYDTNKITSEDLGGKNINYNSPTKLTVGATAYDVLGAKQTEAQTYADRLLELNKSLEGQSAYKREQEGVYGIDTKTKIVNDLYSQLNQLQAEASSIPLQLSKEAQGKGITTTMLSRQEARALRDNTIETLRVSAQYQAAQGNLSAAEKLVEKAVSAKYDPIKEQIDTAKANLDIIINSPEYTNEEKQRAAQQKEIEDKKEKQVKLLEKEDTNKLNLINKVLTNSANLSAQTLTDIVKQIQSDKITYEQALEIATQSGVFQDKATTTDSNKSLSVSDIEKIKESYPQIAGKIRYGMTENDINNLISSSETEKMDAYEEQVYYMDLVKKEIANGENVGLPVPFDRLERIIDNDTNIINKEDAKVYAAEQLGVNYTPKISPLEERIKSGGKFSINEINNEIEKMKNKDNTNFSLTPNISPDDIYYFPSIFGD